MLGGTKKKRLATLFLIIVGLASFAIASFSSNQTDPFYLRVLEKAQKSFFAKDYWNAAQDFEIAAFGLSQDKTLKAKTYIYLGLSHFYLKNSEKSAGFLRQGVELLGDRSLAVLELPESVLPDLETLLNFFDIQLAQLAPLINPSAPPEKENQGRSSETSMEKDQKAEQPAKKATANIDQDDPGNTPPLALSTVKEGDIIALDMVDTLPVVTQRIPAVYPSSAVGSGIGGTVTVNALISENGSVIKTEIIRGIKGIGLNQAAEQAVRRWKFEPAAVKGIKVKVWMPINIVFKKQE